MYQDLIRDFIWEIKLGIVDILHEGALFLDYQASTC